LAAWVALVLLVLAVRQVFVEWMIRGWLAKLVVVVVAALPQGLSVVLVVLLVWMVGLLILVPVVLLWFLVVLEVVAARIAMFLAVLLLTPML